MIKRIFALICIASLFSLWVEANPVTINLRVTMPQVISVDMQDKETAPKDEKSDKTVTLEETRLNGRTVLIKTIVCK